MIGSTQDHNYIVNAVISSRGAGSSEFLPENNEIHAEQEYSIITKRLVREIWSIGIPVQYNVAVELI